jgi:hypothetical protein
MNQLRKRFVIRTGVAGWLFVALVASGCANLHSISRRTDVPDRPGVRAIHLDAQQRLVIFTAKRYCAEPSPDALAAYAAAIGVSGNTRAGDGGAGSIAASTAVASMGLRTQSITLMRDTLYRTCEASANGDLGPAQVAVLLTRSQHLAAVILAIEQLTGAIAMGPTAVGGSAGSNAAAVLLANAQAVEAAKRIEDEAKLASDDATKAESEAEAADSGSTSDLAAAEKALKDAVAAKEPADQIAAKQATVDEAEAKAKAASEKLADARTVASDKKSALARAADTRRLVEAARDNAILTTSAGTASNAQLGTISRTAPYPNQGKEIAKSVENMIVKLLEKSYERETCLIVLTDKKYIDRADQVVTLARSVNSEVQSLAATGVQTEVRARQGIVDYCLGQLGKNSTGGND